MGLIQHFWLLLLQRRCRCYSVYTQDFLWWIRLLIFFYRINRYTFKTSGLERSGLKRAGGRKVRQRKVRDMKGLGYIKRPATVGPATKQCGRDILLRETSEVSFYVIKSVNR
jgi:hypothetical protein